MELHKRNNILTYFDHDLKFVHIDFIIFIFKNVHIDFNLGSFRSILDINYSRIVVKIYFTRKILRIMMFIVTFAKLMVNYA